MPRDPELEREAQALLVRVEALRRFLEQESRASKGIALTPGVEAFALRVTA